MQELIELEEKFQPFLQNNDYTFIGPVDNNLMEGFIRTTNMLAPVVSFSRSIHHALSHKQSVRTALGSLPNNSELRIYVVLNESNEFLFHSTIEEYCERKKIIFK